VTYAVTGQGQATDSNNRPATGHCQQIKTLVMRPEIQAKYRPHTVTGRENISSPLIH